MRYFCGTSDTGDTSDTSDTVDTSNTAISSDASKREIIAISLADKILVLAGLKKT